MIEFSLKRGKGQEVIRSSANHEQCDSHLLRKLLISRCRAMKTEEGALKIMQAQFIRAPSSVFTLLVVRGERGI